MQDHHLVEDDGTRTAVSDLPLAKILELLVDGVEVIEGLTEKDFLDRLEIELVRRRLGL